MLNGDTRVCLNVGRNLLMGWGGGGGRGSYIKAIYHDHCDQRHNCPMLTLEALPHLHTSQHMLFDNRTEGKTQNFLQIAHVLLGTACFSLQEWSEWMFVVQKDVIC